MKLLVYVRVYEIIINSIPTIRTTTQRVKISQPPQTLTNCKIRRCDQVGSLRAITDTNKNIIKEVSYDTFGNILSDSNEAFNIPFGFAGGLQDNDTGLVRFGYRDYDPFTGKWTAKDPIGFSGGDSNLYGYVLVDSWYSKPIFIQKMNDLGLKVISRMSNNNKIGNFVGKHKTLESLYNHHNNIKQSKQGV